MARPTAYLVTWEREKKKGVWAKEKDAVFDKLDAQNVLTSLTVDTRKGKIEPLYRKQVSTA